jgi:hypothetical protein
VYTVYPVDLPDVIWGFGTETNTFVDLDIELGTVIPEVSRDRIFLIFRVKQYNMS